MMLINGDILFIKAKGEEIDEAIASVYTGHDGNLYNHVGIYYNGFVIEATLDGVLRTSLDKYLSKSSTKVLVGRSALYGPAAAMMAEKYVGMPYNDTFVSRDDSFYCSDLIHKVFEEASGYEFFKKHPLSFSSNQGIDVSDFWKEYYSLRGMMVPTNEKGSNPANLSVDEKLTEKFYISN